MSGTTFKGGVSTDKQYSGNVDTLPNNYASRVATKAIERTAVIHCIGSEADASERTTDFSLPTNAIVTDVYINVLTVDATETVDIGTEGTSNDPNGFLAGVSLATAGLVKGSLADGAITLGALLYEETGTGADVAYAKTDCISAGGDPISFTCSSGTNTAVFDIIIKYIEIV